MVSFDYSKYCFNGGDAIAEKIAIELRKLENGALCGCYLSREKRDIKIKELAVALEEQNKKYDRECSGN